MSCVIVSTNLPLLKLFRVDSVLNESVSVRGNDCIIYPQGNEDLGLVN